MDRRGLRGDTDEDEESCKCRFADVSAQGKSGILVDVHSIFPRKRLLQHNQLLWFWSNGQRAERAQLAHPSFAVDESWPAPRAFAAHLKLFKARQGPTFVGVGEWLSQIPMVTSSP
jgi:hypothetical protein